MSISLLPPFYKGWPSCQEAHISVEMGVFGPEGACETAQGLCEELNGVPVGRLGTRILYLVGSYS